MQLSDYLSIAAIVVSLVAAIAAIATVRVYRRAIEVDTYHQATDLFLKVNEIFIAYPELRPLFYEGEELEEQDGREQRALMVAEHILDIFDWIGHKREGASDEDRDAWLDYIKTVFTQSPILRRYQEQNPNWHPVLAKMLGTPPEV